MGKSYFLIFVLFSVFISGMAQNRAESDYQLKNPVTVDYLKKNLRKQSPRLILTPEMEKQLKAKLKTDTLVQNLYKSVKYNAGLILQKGLITLDIPEDPESQQNQLGISRDFLGRVNMLGMVYRIEKDREILKRLNDEIVAACNFPSWNPKHYLDVAEMSLAIALAVDWVGKDLPESTVSLAKRSLIEKGIMPSWPENGSTPSWINGTNNWNQVCNAGMIAASIIIAGQNPELAAKTISRSVNGMNHALKEYFPDGAYPEGPVYWGYGTQFTALTASILETSFGTDFGISEFPGFMESAVYASLTTSPTGKLFNYADCNEISEGYTAFTLLWFAAKTGNPYFLDKKMLSKSAEVSKVSRLAGAGLIWLAQYQENASAELPSAWQGRGENPIVVFTGEDNNKKGFYFAGKGGKASLSHGNMDAGSFVFELNGVRWAVDPGNQSYGLLERAGFNLWGRCQECDRWKLLTKNNFGHSTISVNDQLFLVDGKAEMVDFKEGKYPEATFNLNPVFDNLLKSAKRKFLKDSSESLVIEDEFEISEETKWIAWQMITQAEVQPTKNGAILRQEGKKLNLEILEPAGLLVSVVSLDPPPLAFDKTIENLKRIEIRIPAWTIEAGKTKIKVRLAGE